MAFRNDEQVDLQDLLFDDERGRDFFRTVVFECPVDVSLNWKLTDREKAILTGGFGRPDADAPGGALARVKDYMTGRDSYEFHKWRIDHRNDPTFQRQLKARYDEQLRGPGDPGHGAALGSAKARTSTRTWSRTSSGWSCWPTGGRRAGSRPSRGRRVRRAARLPMRCDRLTVCRSSNPSFEPQLGCLTAVQLEP